MADITLQDLKDSIDSLKADLDSLKTGMDEQFDHVNKRFDHVDCELRVIKGKINELIDVSGEGGLQGQKVIKFPDSSPDAEEL